MNLLVAGDGEKVLFSANKRKCQNVTKKAKKLSFCHDAF